MTDFAKAQLMKYGWTEGKGLGKNENGITTALKPALKFDTAGIGHNKYIDGNQWWEAVYNKAANNIVIDTHTKVLSATDKNVEDHVPKEELHKKKSNQSSQYSNFLKTSILCNGNLVPEKMSTKNKKETESNIAIVQLTDEELFKACGGRTGHKGARHGLTLNGKLKRIAEQEEQMLASSLSTGITKNTLKKINYSSSEDETDKINTNLPLDTSLPEESKILKSSRHKKRYRRKVNDLTHQLDVSFKLEDDHFSGQESSSKNKKLRKKAKEKKIKHEDLSNELNSMLHTSQETSMKKKKKSKRKRIDRSPDKNTSSNESESKRKKPKKCRDENEKGLEDLQRNCNLITPKKDLEPDSSYETENTDTTLETCTKKDKQVQKESFSQQEARRLNNRNSRRKAAKLRKKVKIKLEQITASLENVHFDSKESFEISSPQKKINSIVNNLMTVQIADDVTAKIKKKSRTRTKKPRGE